MKNCRKVKYTSLNQYGYSKFLKHTKLEPILVPVRMRGLTSSGTRGNCYYNAANLVEIFGGKVVVGWCAFNLGSWISTSNNRPTVTSAIRLFGHAMWLNTEYKLSDPTAKSWITDKEHSEQQSDIWRFIWEHGNPYVQFIPLYESDHHVAFEPLSVDIERVTDFGGTTIKDWTVYVINRDNSRRELDWKRIKTGSNIINYMDYNGSDSNFINKEADKICRHTFGIFSEKSSATGMTLDQIRADRIKRANTLSVSLLAEYKQALD